MPFKFKANHMTLLQMKHNLIKIKQNRLYKPVITAVNRLE